MKESELVHDIATMARRRLAHVQVFAQPARVRQQLKGWPDIAILYFDHLILVEAKGDGGELEPSQVEFYQSIAPHVGDHVHYIVARYETDVSYLMDRIKSRIKRGRR